MEFNRRQWMSTLAAGLALGASACRRSSENGKAKETASTPLRSAAGDVDWRAVRNLLPLKPDWTQLASFLLVSHPKPVSAAIQHFRDKIDDDPTWIEQAAFSDSVGNQDVDVARLGCDFFATGIHKWMLGPRGIGFL